MYHRIILSLTIGALCAGCAATRPSIMVLPSGGASMAEFQADEAACQPYAEAKSKAAYDAAGWQSFGRQLTAGVYGAALGSAIGGRYGAAGYGANVGAMAGMNRWAVYGYDSQYSASQQAYDLAYAQCMRTKGHKLPGYQSIDDQPSRTASSTASSTAMGPMQCAQPELQRVCKAYRVRQDLYRTHCEDRSVATTAFSGEGAELTKDSPRDEATPGTYQAERCTLVPVS